MQTFTPETPQRPRRSDRYNRPDGEAAQRTDAPAYTPSPVPPQPPVQAEPQPQFVQRTGQAYPPASVPPARRESSMSRPASAHAERQPSRMLQSSAATEDAVRREARESYRLPALLTAALVVMTLVCAGLFAGEKLMQAYLTTCREERAAAYERVVNAHPVQYRQLIDRYADEYNLHPAFVCAIILNESSFNTSAESRVGARGLMQLMPDTAQWIAHKLNMDGSFHVDMLWEAETNIRFGCWYLSYLSGLFGGDAIAVSSAYHAGQGEIAAWLQNEAYAPGGRLGLDTMPEGPTKKYAGRVTRDYAIYDALYDQVFNKPSVGGDAADGVSTDM